MAKKKSTAQSKILQVMREFKKGLLKSGKSEKKVENREQAVAIALSQARKVDPSMPANPKRKK